MNKPFILDNAAVRTGDAGKIFEYDYQMDMNVVKFKDGNVPFINMDRRLNELATMTKVKRESDDEEFFCGYELYTKTDTIRERDDESNSFLELESKTFVERERDDEDDIDFN